MTHPNARQGATIISKAWVCECGHAYSNKLYQQIKEDKCANPHCRTPLRNCTYEDGEFYPYCTTTYFDDTSGMIYKDWRDL